MASLKNFIACILFMALSSMAVSEGIIGEIALDGTWLDGHATFYGDMTGSETMQGACGYGNLFQQGYGLQTTALSTALFNNGFACGACFEIICVNDRQWCKPGAGPITVTATNFCPPGGYPPWCSPPKKHFDLSMPMFVKIAYAKAGIIPVKYRRVACRKRGGIQFQLGGNPNYITVLVYNVGGAGDVNVVRIKGSNSDWIQMRQEFGQTWQTGTNLVGQGLSFEVTTSDGKTIDFDNVAGAGWQFGQILDGKRNF